MTALALLSEGDFVIKSLRIMSSKPIKQALSTFIGHDKNRRPQIEPRSNAIPKFF